MKLNSLSDLDKLLPESVKKTPGGARMHDGKGATIYISVETKGRAGKTVTLIRGLQHNPATMNDIARMLKEKCGTGGTVKDRTIELQGDRRERAKTLLEEMNYALKER